MEGYNPQLHSQMRLAVMFLLHSVDEADFAYHKEEKTESTAGNLSVLLDKLASAGYIYKVTEGVPSRAQSAV